MTAKMEAILKLNALQSGDPECAHADADDIILKYLCDTGGDAVARAFVRASDRVGFWYT